MRNSRRRREILILAELLGSTVKIVQEERFKPLALFGPFQSLEPLDLKFKRAVPSQQERHRELLTAQKVVNDLVSPRVWSWSLQMRLWFTAQLVRKLCEAGWRCPVEPPERDLVQGLYDLSSHFPGVSDLPKSAVDALENVAERMHKYGLYGL